MQDKEPGENDYNGDTEPGIDSSDSYCRRNNGNQNKLLLDMSDSLLGRGNECRTGQFCPSKNWSWGCGAAGRSEHLIPREAAVEQEYHVMCEAGGR